MAEKTTQAAEMLPEVQKTELVPGFGTVGGFELLQRQAKLLASSSLVPKEYHGNIANCTIAMNMANRINADPLMVMQNLHVINGRPGWSAQFLIATFNTCGRFSAIRYEWVGQPGTDSWGCKAWAVELATGQKLEGAPVTIEIAKKEGWFSRNGSKWQTMPAQMLMYRAAAWFIRAYAPEIAMGMHTVEEIIDMTETPEGKFIFDVQENANKEVLDIEDVELADNAQKPAQDVKQTEPKAQETKQTPKQPNQAQQQTQKQPQHQELPHEDDWKYSEPPF